MTAQSLAGPARSAGSASRLLSGRAEPRSGTRPGYEGSAGGAGTGKMSNVITFLLP